MMRARIVIAMAVLLLFGPRLAATPCDDAFREAQKSHDLGLFEDVPAQLAPCLGTRMSRPLAIDVHSLLARTYLEIEELEKARAEISTILRLDATFDPGSKPRFAALVAEVRRAEMTTQVASVSKTSESLREAPATVIVISGEEIRRRGYLDLEQLLHDLPGFDVSRVNGSSYANLAQRGYFIPGNDRNLLLIDGVEQNDIAFGTAFFSRQYPLTNIDRVEIIYGPAATMYGAHAFTGVISVLTKSADKLVPEGRNFGLTGQVTAGGHGGGSVDMTASGRDGSGTFAWSVSAIYQQADERDLSPYRYWDLTFREVDYKSKPWMRAGNSPVEQEVFCSAPSPYIRCDESGASLTDAGQELVRSLDAAAMSGFGFADRAKNWGIFGKVQFAGLTLGIEKWRSQEGLTSEYPSIGNADWTPKLTAAYLKYSLPLSTVKLDVFMRYMETGLERGNSRVLVPHTYNFGFLSLWSLVPPCMSPLDPVPVSCAPAAPWVETITYGNISTQFRSEVQAVWEPSRTLNGVAGIELTRSSVEGGYDRLPSGPGYVVPLPQPGVREHTDYAVFAQSAWKPLPWIKFAVAGRLTYNQINNRPGERGFGALFTPRVAMIYTPRTSPFVLKAIYSEAFIDPIDQQKYGTLSAYSQAYPSNGLTPESAKNFELSAIWSPAGSLSVEGAAYQARYSDLVALGYPRNPDGSLVAECSIGCDQYQNRDSLRIRGLQLSATYRRGRSEAWANYTHTRAVQADPLDFLGNPLLDESGQRVREVRGHSIAPNTANAGVSASFGRLDAQLRANYVDRRLVAPSAAFPIPNWPIGEVGGRTTADAVLTYRLPHNVSAQVSALNLLDRQYWDPGNIGTGPANPAVLQAGRTLYLRLIYALPFHNDGHRESAGADQ